MTLNKKYSLAFLNVGKRAILSHFSFKRPFPFKGPPLMSPNLDNCEFRLKSRKE